MIPYWPQPVLTLGPLTIHAFGLCVAAALLTGYFLVYRRAERFGLPKDEASGIYVATVFAGLLAGFLWSLASGGQGISNTGLLLGGSTCLVLMTRGKRAFRSVVDLYGLTLPVVFMIARFGCFLAHDHVGRLTDSWLGVQFPGGNRFDLGLLQSIMSAVTAGVLIGFKRKPVPAGGLALTALTMLTLSNFIVR